MSTPAALPPKVSIAFLVVLIIWSTTPLGIVWSSETVSPTLAVFLRMLIALTLGLLMILFSPVRLPFNKKAVKLYAISSIGVVGGMLLTYMAARTVPSGILSLMFGLAPLFSGLLAQKILNEPTFGVTRLLALACALIGLGIVCSGSFSLSSDSWSGLVMVLMAVLLFSLSGVLIKTIEISINPLASTVGALLFSTPIFFLAWLIFDGNLATDAWQARSLWSIVYLGVFGSLIGFIAYFYVLQKLNASTVSLVTLIAPVFAMMLGTQLNGEIISASLVVGAAFVIVGLALYQFGEAVRKRLGW